MQRRLDRFLEAHGGFEIIGQVQVGLDQFQLHQAEAPIGAGIQFDALLAYFDKTCVSQKESTAFLEP